MAQNAINATKALYEAMSLASGQTSRETPWDSPGYVEGSPEELKTFPGYLPFDSFEWPAAIMELRRSEEAHSQLGYFPALQRAWIVVDSTFAMWNPFTGRDLQFYTELQNVIVAVGEPIQPKEGVFPSSVRYIVPLAGDGILCFVGIECRTHEGSVLEAKLVDLDCFLSTPCMITSIACCHTTSDVVMGGSNGLLYIVHFSESIFGNRIKLVPALGLIPISAVSTLMRTLKSVVRGSDAAVMQVVVDQDSGSDNPQVYVLSTDNTIGLYNIENGALKYVTSAKHDAASVQASVRASSSSEEVSPLSGLYCVPKQGLVAVAVSGERFIYSVSESWMSADELSIRHYVPSPLTPERLVTSAWCASNVFVLSHVDAVDGRKPSQATLAAESSGPSVLTNLVPFARDALRIEAVSEATQTTKHPEAVAQLLTGPRQILLLHYSGMLVYAKLRPLETLHLILLEPATVRERLLPQFLATYAAADYCCMLIHLATARHNPRRSSGLGARTPTHNAAIYSAPSVEVRRLAINLLRSMCTPTVHDNTASNFSQLGTREVVMTLSDFSAGVIAYLANVSAPFWGHAVFGVGSEGGAQVVFLDLAYEAEMAILDLQQFLESTDKELWAAPNFPEGAPVRWMRNRAHISLKANAVFSPRDRREVQNIIISAVSDLTQVIVQVHSFISICARLHPSVLGRVIKGLEAWKTTYADLGSSQAKARALSRAVSREVASGRHVLDKEATLLLEEMEAGATHLFAPTDKIEFSAVSQINAVLGAQSYAGVSEAVTQLCAVAGSIWRGGTLSATIEQLTSNGLEAEAVRVLLAAASQISSSDPSARYPSLMDEITGLLEALYVRSNSTFQRLVGSPFHQGEMWLYAPQDSTTHRHLLAWLAASRSDAALVDTLRATLMMVPSSELEPYLSNSTHQLGLLYVRYLHQRKGDADGAIEVCSRLIHDPLATLPSSERLAFRVSCAQEAAEIALQTNSPQRSSIAHVLRILTLQARLHDLVVNFLASGSSFLNEIVEGDDQHRTQREKAQRHLDQMENEVMGSEAVFLTSLEYELFGGIDIALETAVLYHSSDSHLLGSLVEKALNKSNDDHTARELLRRFGGVAGFPLAVLIMVLEARAFLRSPAGCIDVPRILLASHVDAERAFAIYESLVERRDSVVIQCRPFERAGVTSSYLVYSMAVLVTSSNYPRQEADIATLYQIQRRLADEYASPDDGAALEAALGLLQRRRY